MITYVSIEGEVYRFVSYTFNHDGKCLMFEKEFTNPDEEKIIKIYTIDYAYSYLYPTELWGEPGDIWNKPVHSS